MIPHALRQLACAVIRQTDNSFKKPYEPMKVVGVLKYYDEAENCMKRAVGLLDTYNRVGNFDNGQVIQFRH